MQSMSQLAHTVSTVAADARQRGCNLPEVLGRLSTSALATTQLLPTAASNGATKDLQQPSPGGASHCCDADTLQLVTTISAAVADALHNRGSQPLPGSSSSSLGHISTCLRTWIPAAAAAAAAAVSQPPTSPPGAEAAGSGAPGVVDAASSLDTSAAAAAAAMAAMQAGSQLWPSTWQLLPRPERGAVLSFLAALVSGSCSGAGGGRSQAPSAGTAAPTAHTAPSTAAAGGTTGHQVASSQGLGIVLALQAALLLGALLRACSSSMNPEELSAIRSAQVEGLAAAAQDWKRCWSREHCALLLELLDGCIAQVHERRKEWPGAASQLAEAVRRLLVYGVGMQEPFPRLSRSSNTGPGDGEEAAAAATTAAAAAAPQSSPTGAGGEAPGGRRYVPPHLRGQAAAGKPTAGQQPPGATSDTDWSDMSDTSDVEGWTAPGSRRASKTSSSAAGNTMNSTFHRCGRVRAGALMLLQAMIRGDPAALQPHWPSILPSHDPVGARHGSSHLLTVIMSDPGPKLRALGASVLTQLLEGPLPRSILAVAEAKSLARPGIRGFTTLSTSLGQMLLALHTGLTHAVRAEADANVLPNLLRALAALAAVSPYERLPPELLPTMVQLLWSYLIALRPQLFTPQGSSSSSSGSGSTGAATGAPAGVGAGNSSPQQPQVVGDALQAAPPPAAAAAAGAGGGGSSSGTAALTAGLAALAQALSTAKHSSSLDAWMTQRQAARPSKHSSSSSLGARGGPSRMRFNSLPERGGGSSSSSSSGGGSLNQGQVLAAGLLQAAATSPVLDAIEAMAALRGLCVHYMQALPPGCWPQILALAQQTLEVSAQAAVSLAAAFAVGQRSPSRGPSRPSSSCSTRTEADVSGSTSPEFKAAQHGLRLLGDYLTAQRELWLVQQQQREAEEGVGTQAALNTACGASGGSIEAMAVVGTMCNGEGQSSGRTGGHRQPVATTAGAGAAPAGVAGAVSTSAAAAAAAAGSSTAHDKLPAGLCLQWAQVLRLLLGPLVQGHPSGLVRTAAATVVGLLPSSVWLQLPGSQQAAVLQALVHWVGSDPVTAVRGAAAKAAGTMLHQANLLAAALNTSKGCAGPAAPSNGGSAATEVPELLLRLFHELSMGARSAAAASINQHAAWAIGNAAAALTQVLHDPQGWTCQQLGSHPSSSAAAACCAGTREQQLLPQQQPELRDYMLWCIAQLGEGAATAAAGADKVRASGVRALGALLAAWRPAWSLSPAVGQQVHKASTSQAPDAQQQQQQQGGWRQLLPADWPGKALQQVGVCLSTGNMKVQWNAACALGLCLHNPALAQHPQAVVLLPHLLASLVGILSSSPNFKVRSHAAAALEVLPHLGLLGGAPAAAHTLQTLCGVWQELKGPQHMATSSTSSRNSQEGSYSSSGGGAAVAAAVAGVGLSSGARTSSGGAALLLASAGITAGRGGGMEDLDSGDNPNFRYLPAVLDSLAATSTRLLALAHWEQVAPAPGDSAGGASAPLPAQWQCLAPCAGDLAQMLRMRLQQLLSEEQLQQLLEQVAASGAASPAPGAALAAAAAAALGEMDAEAQGAGEQLQQGASRACSLVKLPSDPWGLESCLAASCSDGAVFHGRGAPEQLPEDVLEGLEEVAAAAAALHGVALLLGPGVVPSREGHLCGPHSAELLVPVGVEPAADLVPGLGALGLEQAWDATPAASAVECSVAQSQAGDLGPAGAEVTAWLSQVQLLAAQAKRGVGAAM